MEKLNEIHEVEIVYKRPVLDSMSKVTRPEDSVSLFRQVIPPDRIDYKEFFLVALLGRSNHVLGISMIGMGSTSGSAVNIKEIFQLAIKTNATSIILCHNHPSGNLLPSESDIAITRRIKEACKLCDIVLLDHLIITSEGFYSFIEEI